MAEARSRPGPFAVMDCALIAIASGERAVTLRELIANLYAASPDSLYHHMWGGLLEPRFEPREFNNDFAAWARHGLHDDVLAERLAMIDPNVCGDLEGLRAELIDVCEHRLDESGYLHWAQATEPFEVLRSQIVVFDTHARVAEPEALAAAVEELSASSVFYHFIDARRRNVERLDDFSRWLADFGGGYRELCEALAGIDPYFQSLTDLRARLAEELALHGRGAAR